MKNKQVTIFGGTGFIGRYVVNRLADLGYTIRVASRSSGEMSFLKTAGTVGQITPCICNIHDKASVENALEGSDSVINLVGILAETRGKNKFDELHHQFPKRLSAIAKKTGVKSFVHISALSASVKAPSRYLQTKAKGEKALAKNFPKAVVLRPSIVFGEEDNFFNRFAKMTTISPVLPLIGGGETKFQPVYVRDVAEAVVKAVEDDAVQGMIFELGGPEVYSFAELMKILLDQIDRKRFLVPIPWGVAKIKGWVLQNLPGKLLTRDQVRSLRTDSVVQSDAKTLSDLGIEATPLRLILPTYLARFKPGGRFGIEVEK